MNVNKLDGASLANTFNIQFVNEVPSSGYRLNAYSSTNISNNVKRSMFSFPAFEEEVISTFINLKKQEIQRYKRFRDYTNKIRNLSNGTHCNTYLS